jgi:CRP/FNR family transcriptional regulator, nitrogen oxide reductase regulator
MPATAIAPISDGLRSQFLAGLSPTDRQVILSAASQRHFAARSVITHHGHPAEQLYLLSKGLVRYFFITDQGKKVLLRWIGPGDVFGGRAILSSPSNYLFSAESVSEISTFVWSRPAIRSLVTQHPLLLENALLTASDHVDWQLTSYLALANLTARQRVAQILITLARTVGQSVPGGVSLRITNEELASAANVTSFTASRLVSQWQRERALVKRRGQVLVVSPERMLFHML